MRETIALIPGAYKPPTRAHWSMVTEYANRATIAVILISKPGSKNARYTKSGREITALDSKKIFEIYKKRYGINNIKIEISPTPSPVQATYDFVEHNLKGVNVIVGASTKDGDWKRWTRISKYMKEKNPTITILDPETYAVESLEDDNGINISASQIRENINDFEFVKKALPEKLTEKDINKIKRILY